MTEPSPVERITLYGLLEKSAIAALDLQRDDGSFPPGRNGIYDEPETPVRTTSHWLTTLVKVYEITGHERFADAANAAADYLLSDEARPFNYTFHSRSVEEKDMCDGLVGQAAPIRGLSRASSVLERPELLETAKEVFSLHPFDVQLGLWERVEIDGDRLSFDRTLNHQILFAAASSLLIEESESVDRTIHCFLDALGSNMRNHSDGLVKHHVRPPLSAVLRTALHNPQHWNLVWNEMTSHYYSISNAHRQKEHGYHPTVMSGLAKLKNRMPDHDVWSQDPIEMAKSYTNSEECLQQFGEKETGYGSLSPGINYALFLSAFHDAEADEIRPWIEAELRPLYDERHGLLNEGAEDPAIRAGLIMAVSHLPNIAISV